MEDHDKERHYAIIVDDEKKLFRVGCGDYRNEHPLQHSTIVAIDYLSSNSFYSRENLIKKFLEKKPKKMIY
jgi:hypothetical protein